MANEVTSAYTSILHTSAGDMNVATFEVNATSANDNVLANVNTYILNTAFAATLESVPYFMIEKGLNTEASTGFSVYGCEFSTLETWTLDSEYKSTPYALYYRPTGSEGGGVWYGKNDDNQKYLYLGLIKFTDGSVYLLRFDAGSAVSGSMTFFASPISSGEEQSFNPIEFEYGNYGALSSDAYTLHGEVSTDPYSPGGDSTYSDSDDATWDDSGDSIEIPGLPTLSAISTGFVTLYRPSLAQLNSLSTYMWNNDLFSVDTYKKLFANPMDCILGLNVVPVNPGTSGTSTVKVGNIDTGISMDVASSQYVTVNCGSVAIQHYSGSCFDYEPYTKIQLYLPYIGFRDISTDEVMGGSIEVEYHVDVLSGGLIAFVRSRGRVIGEYSGSCNQQIPVCSSDFSAIIQASISVAASVGSMVASRGASALGDLSNIASNVVGMKPNIQKSGCTSGVAGTFGNQYPYLIIQYPNQCKPKLKGHYIGWPSEMFEQMGNLSGYTEIDEANLANTGATQEEYAEIISLLKSGVIF